MYRTLTIGAKDYKIEFTIEALLYDECAEKMTMFFGNISGATQAQTLTEGMDDKEKETAVKLLVKNSISGISSIPSTTITVLYAGLLEHHGTGKNGDKTVQSKEDVKNIVRQYFEEHPDDGKGDFYELLRICMEQMEEDNFFDRTGLAKFMGMLTTENNPPKPNRAQRRAAEKASGK